MRNDPGTAYGHWVLRAQREASARGEFYTSPGVSAILNAVIHATIGRPESVYDPACGTEDLLTGIEADSYFGQEVNPETAEMCRGTFPGMEVRVGDTLADLLHPGMKFHAVVSNPPYSIRWNPPASDTTRTDPH